jgi:hypothetical protein
MAKDRINPEFNPQRILQPTANPVDTYFRINLTQPEPSRQLQIVKALGELNPQLQRLTSDAMDAMIAKEKNIGAIEASQDTPEMALKKQADYIEKSGGLAPWRYSSYLKNTGANIVRDKYQNPMYARLDDLSEPYNQDGTLRSPDYIKTQMEEMYKAAGVPSNSYYITQGALEAKAAVDSAVIEKVTQMRAQKTKTYNEHQLEDNISAVLEITPDDALIDAVGPKGKITELKDTFYKQGFGSGDDQFISAMSKRIDGLVASHNYDSARSIVGFMLSNPVAGRALGARNRPLLQQKLNEIETRQEQYDSIKDSREDRAINRSLADVSASLRGDLVDMYSKSPDGYISMSVAAMNEMANSKMASLNIPEDHRKRIQADVVSQLKNQIAGLNQPLAKNPKVYEDLYYSVKSMTPDSAKTLVNTFEATGLISPMQATEITSDIEARSRLAPFIGETIESATQATRNGLWTGYELSEFDPEYVSKIRTIGEDAASSVRDRLIAWSSSPENIQASKSDPVRFQADLRAKAQDLMRETQNNLKTANAEDLQQYNRRTGFEYTDKSGQLTATFGDLMEGAVGEMQLGDKFMQKSILNRAEMRGRDLLREAYNQAPAGMTVTQKTEYLRKQIPDMVFKVRKEMIDGDPRTVSPNMAKAVQAGQQVLQTPAPAGVRTEGTQTVGPAIQGSGWFGTYASTNQELDLFNAGQDFGAKFPKGVVDTNNPKALAEYSAAKGRIQSAAESFLKSMSTMSSGNYRNFVGQSPDLAPWWTGKFPDIKAYSFKEDGIYTLPLKVTPTAAVSGPMTPWMSANAFYKQDMDKMEQPTDASYTQRDDAATSKYWAAKSLVGYSPEEIKSGKTSEGLAIAPAYRDPKTFLYFQSSAEYDAAVEEYNKSDGKSGLIAESILPKLSGITDDEFAKAQFELLMKRKP